MAVGDDYAWRRARRTAGGKSTGGDNASPKPTSSDTEWALKESQAELSRSKLQLQNLQNSLKALKKPDAKNKKATAEYNRQHELLSNQIATQKQRVEFQGKSFTAKQNKYYSSTGQYEKLLKGENRDAYLAIDALFKSYGLESLAGKIYDYVKNGYSADTISILLQDTKEYKERFAGNEARKKAGLPVLSPAEYLSTEESYRQILQSAGMPAGFYDQHSDFIDWIGKDVSPTEVQSRVDLAKQATALSSASYKKALNQMGISDGEMAAYFLDSKKALPYLQKTAATAAIGAEALAQGLSFDKTYSEQLATEGISAESAKAGYSNIASELESYKTLGQIYGEAWTQRSAEEAELEGKGEALQQKKRLASRERGSFTGALGTARGGFSQAGGAR